MLPACFDCIHYKEPKSINNYRRFTDISYCIKHKEYAEQARQDEKKCGINGKDFNPRIHKIK
jgi:hypothetical protein